MNKENKKVPAWVLACSWSIILSAISIIGGSRYIMIGGAAGMTLYFAIYYLYTSRYNEAVK